MKKDGHYPYQASIDFYGKGGFRFAEMSHRGSLLCLPTGMHAWDVDQNTTIDASHLKSIFDLADQIDVLLIGQGTEISFFPTPLRNSLREHKIIVEAVSTSSAISTYNILFSENRAVAAALIAVDLPGKTP